MRKDLPPLAFHVIQTKIVAAAQSVVIIAESEEGVNIAQCAEKIVSKPVLRLHKPFVLTKMTKK